MFSCVFVGVELTQRGIYTLTIVWIESNGVQSSARDRVEWKSSAFRSRDDTGRLWFAMVVFWCKSMREEERKELVGLSRARGRTSARTESALSGCVCALTRNTLRLALTGRRYIQRERPRSSARSMFFLLRSLARASPCPPFCLPFKSLAFYPSAGCSSQIYYFGRMMHREIRGFARHCQPSGSFTSALTSW